MFGRIVFVSFVHFQKHKEMTPMKSDTNTLNTEEREREREREGKRGRRCSERHLLHSSFGNVETNHQFVGRYKERKKGFKILTDEH